jgi:hypothetical protein
VCERLVLEASPALGVDQILEPGEVVAGLDVHGPPREQLPGRLLIAQPRQGARLQDFQQRQLLVIFFARLVHQRERLAVLELHAQDLEQHCVVAGMLQHFQRLRRPVVEEQRLGQVVRLDGPFRGRCVGDVLAEGGQRFLTPGRVAGQTLVGGAVAELLDGAQLRVGRLAPGQFLPGARLVEQPLGQVGQSRIFRDLARRPQIALGPVEVRQHLRLPLGPVGRGGQLRDAFVEPAAEQRVGAIVADVGPGGVVVL